MKPVDPREFGIVPPLRTRRPETVIARQNCERLYRFGAAVHFAGLSAREQARLLHQAVKRLRQTSWQYERTARTCPRRHRGKITEVCFAILRVHDAVPSERTIRRALSLTRGPKR